MKKRKGDLFLNNGEFYTSREHNYVGENRQFPAEIYRKPFEENPSGRELADLGQETTSLGRKQPPKNEKGGAKSLIEQVFNSIRSVATATVAVSAIVVTGTVMSSPLSADLVSIDVGSSYVEYQLEISDYAEDTFVILESASEKLTETKIEEDGVHTARVEGLKPEWEYSLSLVTRDPLLGDITRFTHKFQTEKYEEYVPDPPDQPDEPDPPPVIPSATASIQAVTLTGVNLVRVDFQTENVDRLTLRIGYTNQEAEEIEISSADIQLGFALVNIPDTAPTFDVTPIVTSGERTIEGEAFNVHFENNLQISPVVRLYEYNKEISLDVKAITNGATHLHVESDSEYPATGDYYLDELLFYSERGEITLTVYLTDDTGAILSNQITLTIDTSTVESIPDYNMVFSNPSEVGLTFNEDGSINVYVYTGFECADESYFALVTLGEHRVKGRDSLIVFEDLPNDTYPISFDLCFEKDGIIYSVMSFVPSGTVGEIGFYEHYELTGSEFVLSLWDAKSVDLGSIRLLSSSGEEIHLSESDFVIDEDGYLTARVSFADQPESVILYLMYAPYVDGLEPVEEYKGSIYTPIEIEILPY